MFRVVLLLLVSNALALLAKDKTYYDLIDAENYFNDFIMKYTKNYKSTEEYNRRLEIFKDNLRTINDMNANQDATFGITQFADLTPEEWRSYLGFVPSNNDNGTEVVTVKKEWIEEAPVSLDYRDKNLVTEVKNQHGCGSSFVFSAIGNIEGQYAMKYKKLVSFSEQEGLDCDIVPDEDCNNGGQMISIMNTLAQIGGSMPEEDYPYNGVKGTTCHLNKDQIVAKVLRGQIIGTKTADLLVGAVTHIGPLAVSMYMPQGAFLYKGGVFSPPHCDGTPNHAVVVIGYGIDVDSKKDYWLIKNSWGKKWGEDGYLRLEIGLCNVGQEGTASAEVA